MASTGDRPAPKQPVLDLDALAAETEGEAPDERYHVLVKGEKVHFTSFEDLDWETVERIQKHLTDGDLTHFFHEVIEDDDELNLFFEQEYKPKVIEKVLEGYYKHNGWDPRRGRLNRAARRAR